VGRGGLVCKWVSGSPAATRRSAHHFGDARFQAYDVLLDQAEIIGPGRVVRTAHLTTMSRAGAVRSICSHTTRAFILDIARRMNAR